MATILERRIRPIFDCLDVGAFKKAAQEADKVLKKSPNLQCARALKALALLRMGREEEFQQMFSVLQKENISDDSTLQVMKFVYRETEQPMAICKMYEDAVKLEPNNEEIVSHLFMSYVPMNNFKGQQNVAMQLYRLKPNNNPYYFWAVMSIVLQAKRGPDSADEMKRKLLFTLAQRMLDKFIAEGKIEAEQEVQLYMSILQEQGKFQEALDFLQGPLGTKFYPGVPIEVQLDLLRNLGRWKEVNEIMRKLLEAQTDRWDYYQDYLKSSLELIKGNATDNEYTFEACHEFICQLIESSPKKVRGPFLARLELHRIMREEKADAEALLGNYSQLLLEYFRNFGDRNCCPHDLKVFAPFLSAEEYKSFPEQLLAMAPLAEDGSSTTETMIKHICAVQVTRFWDTTDRSKEAMEALASKLIGLYSEYNKRFEGKLLTTDISPCDQFIVLAVHILCDLAIQNSSSDYLIKALALLTRLHEASPSNIKAMLLTVKIFHWLGFTPNASDVHNTIEPKYIQYDSLGYLHTGLLAPFSWSQQTVRVWYTLANRFFVQSTKESVEYVATSYRNGTFSKLQELLDFRDRLANSLHNQRIATESAILELVTITGTPNSNNFAGVQQVRNLNINPEHRTEENLVDNRDLEVIIRWDPIVVNDFDDDATKERKRVGGLEYVREQSFKEQSLLLRIRKAFLNLLVAQVNGLTGHVHHSRHDVAELKETTSADFAAVLKKLRGEWRDLFASVPQVTKDHYQESYLVNRLLSQLHFVLQVPYAEFMDNLSALSLALIGGEVAEESRGLDKLGESVVASIVGLVNLVRDVIRKQSDASDPFWTYRTIVETVASAVELLSVATLIVAVLDKRSAGKGAGATKGAKKPNQTTSSSSEWTKAKQTAISSVTKCLKEQLAAVDSLLESWSVMAKFVTESLRERVQALVLGSGSVSALEKQESVLRGKFVASHDWTMTDLRAVLKEKQKFISKT